MRRSIEAIQRNFFFPSNLSSHLPTPPITRIRTWPSIHTYLLLPLYLHRRPTLFFRPFCFDTHRYAAHSLIAYAFLPNPTSPASILSPPRSRTTLHSLPSLIFYASLARLCISHIFLSLSQKTCLLFSPFTLLEISVRRDARSERWRFIVNFLRSNEVNSP